MEVITILEINYLKEVDCKCNYSGIYAIINNINDKIYIGSTFDIYARIKAHISLLRQQKHHNCHLQNAFDVYGESSFIYIILEKCIADEEILRNTEQKYMDFFQSYNHEKGYNIRFDATNRKQSEEEKIRRSIKWKKMYAEGKLKFFVDYKFTKEEKQQISERVKKDWQNNILRKQKQSERTKGINNPMFGKTRLNSDEILRLCKDYKTMSISKLSNIYGIPMTTVRGYLYKNNIKMRPQGDPQYAFARTP